MSTSKDPMIGARLNDLTLKKQIGQGAMGTVYLALKDSGEKVAVKFLTGEFSNRPEFIQRFINEAKACMELDHPHIVRVLNAGEIDGTRYMVMEYFEGENLSYFLKTQDRVKEAKARSWMRQAADALKYAHGRGIIHRDIKPENLMVNSKGVVKVMDLGLSKNLESDENYSMTMSGTVIGTPYYISPEQIRHARHVDPRTDQYSLGATFYHLTTGYPPFDGESAAEVMSKHMNEVPVDPRRRVLALSDGWSDILNRTMDKDPNSRFKNMDALLDALERLDAGRSVIHGKLKLKPDGIVGGLSLKSWIRPVALLGLGLILLGISAWGFRAGMKWITSSPKSGIPIQSLNVPPVQPPPPVVPAPKPMDHPSTGGAVPAAEEALISSLIRPHSSESPPARAESSTPVPRSETAIPAVRVEKDADSTEEVESIHIGAGDKTASDSTLIGETPSDVSLTYNWMDLVTLGFIIAGIPMVRTVGFLWGLFRCIAFWAGMYLIVYAFKPVYLWLQTLSIPPGTASVMSFCMLSLVVIVFAWTVTHKIRGHEEDDWKRKMDRILCFIPGLFAGAAFASWMLAFLVITAPETFPVEKSWSGNQMFHRFPNVKEASEMFNTPRKKP